MADRATDVTEHASPMTTTSWRSGVEKKSDMASRRSSTDGAFLSREAPRRVFSSLQKTPSDNGSRGYLLKDIFTATSIHKDAAEHERSSETRLRVLIWVSLVFFHTTGGKRGGGGGGGEDERGDEKEGGEEQK